MIYTMSDTKKRIERTTDKAGQKAEETRLLLKEKLYKAKATGELTEDDEAEILRYAVGVVTRRGDKPRD